MDILAPERRPTLPPSSRLEPVPFVAQLTRDARSQLLDRSLHSSPLRMRIPLPSNIGRRLEEYESDSSSDAADAGDGSAMTSRVEETVDFDKDVDE